MGQVQFFDFQVATRDIEGLTDARGDSIKSMLESDYSISVDSVKVILGYQVKSDISESDAQSAIYDLFADPIIEVGVVNESIINDHELFPTPPEIAITVGFKPGVTDNPGKAALDGFRTIFPNASIDSDISTYITYAFYGVNGQATPEFIASKLNNNQTHYGKLCRIQIKPIILNKINYKL